MKKLTCVLFLAGALSVPSAVFAEASWYGSLRVGVQSSDSNISIADGASRWGIRGSVEAGEGLTGVYRFETKIGANNATSPGGRLSYVGLSGGFGTVTLGQVWSASFNATGAMTDNSNYYGDSETTYRHGNAISYAFSNDAMSLQADATYGADGGPKDLERFEFGLTVNVGDIGAVAVSYMDDKHATTLEDVDDDDTTPDVSTDWRTKTTVVTGQMSVAGMTVYVGSGKDKYTNITADDGDGDPNVGADGFAKPDDKTTFFGARGGLGDTGMSYVFQWRDKDTHKPWVLALNKSLGDATLIVEHGNGDDAAPDKTQVGLKISF